MRNRMSSEIKGVYYQFWLCKYQFNAKLSQKTKFNNEEPDQEEKKNKLVEIKMCLKSYKYMIMGFSNQ